MSFLIDISQEWATIISCPPYLTATNIINKLEYYRDYIIKFFDGCNIQEFIIEKYDEHIIFLDLFEPKDNEDLFDWYDNFKHWCSKYNIEVIR